MLWRVSQVIIYLAVTWTCLCELIEFAKVLLDKYEM